MFAKDQIIEIFFKLDEFWKKFSRFSPKCIGQTDRKKRHYHRDGKMSMPEIMLIMILFHSSGYRCLKHFYLNEVCGNMKDMFPNVVSYNRFTELQKVSLLPLFAFFRTQLRGKCTGISFVDSTPLRVCKNQRIRQHKVFAGFAERGCCSMGWFYGFKLHLICNERGELLSFAFTKGNIDDRKPLEDKQFIKDIYGKLVGGGGYISKSLFRTLFVDGIHLLTRLKSNMKGSILSAGDSLLIRKRAIIESVNDELKNIAQVEHSRHRSLHNFLVNMMSAISAYCLFPKKPSIRLEPVSATESCRQLCLF